MSATITKREDFGRLKNNLQRVLWLLAGGEWCSANELREVGGSEWGRRLRTLREPRFGMTVESRRISGGAWAYRLDLDTLDPTVYHDIMSGNFSPIKRNPKPDVLGTIQEILDDDISTQAPETALHAIRCVLKECM